MLQVQAMTPAAFLATLTPKSLVITPNRRLATRLRQNLLQSLDAGQSLLAPEILAYQDWLQQTHRHLQLHGHVTSHLLDNTALAWLFAKTLPQDIALLSSPERLAKTAKQAWQLVHEGCLPWWQLRQDPHPDYQWFGTWAQHIKTEFEQRQYTDTHYFAKHHLQHIATAVASRYHHLQWYGFMDFSVLQRHLQTALTDAGCPQMAVVAIHPTPSQQPRLMHASDPEQELKAMLEAAKAMQAEGLSHIACVVPQLTQHRAQVVTAAWQCFAPHTPWPTYQKDAPVNISGGYYLSELAPIQTTMALIRLWQRTVSYETLATLLLSPYWGSTDHSACFADIERYWRQAVATELPLASWLALLPDNHPGTALLQTLWQPLVNQARQLPRQAYPSQWVQRFKQQLADLYWPGAHALDSWHYQVAQALLQQLEQLASYDSLMGELSLSTMLQLWHDHASQTLFQAETQDQAVEILGTLEATGLTWQWLWVCQLQAQDFPEYPKPNPLLPLSWQQAAGLPHTDAKREQAYAQQLLQAWQSQSAQLTLSYSQHIDGLPAEGSLLLEPWQPSQAAQRQRAPLPTHVDLIATKNFSSKDADAASNFEGERFFAPTKIALNLEIIPETTLPAIQESLPGGSYHLQRFIDCPFKAFGYHRLGIVPLAQKTTGLNPMQRGQAVHQSLQLLWQQLGSQAALRALDVDALNTAILHAVNRAMHPWQHQLPAVIWQQQVAWLNHVLHTWLLFEKSRTPFQVESLEQAHTLTLAGVTIKLRSDRIDVYADGSVLVIDYKTGASQVSDSFKIPLVAPQMPLYLLALQAKEAGFAYVSLKPGQIGWNGVADTIAESGLKTFSDLNQKYGDNVRAYPQQLAAWQTELETLTTACIHNQAPLNPRTPEACRYCDLAALCRRDELIIG